MGLLNQEIKYLPGFGVKCPLAACLATVGVSFRFCFPGTGLCLSIHGPKDTFGLSDTFDEAEIFL